MFYVYILKSLRDDKHYFGHSHNIDKRLIAHNAGKVRSTKGRKPFQIHYFETVSTKSEAAKREFFFKTIDGRMWLKSKGIL